MPSDGKSLPKASPPSAMPGPGRNFARSWNAARERRLRLRQFIRARLAPATTGGTRNLRTGPAWAGDSGFGFTAVFPPVGPVLRAERRRFPGRGGGEFLPGFRSLSWLTVSSIRRACRCPGSPTRRRPPPAQCAPGGPEEEVVDVPTVPGQQGRLRMALTASMNCGDVPQQPPMKLAPC